MGILKLKTTLTDIPYGNDRAGGGSSNEPYIKSTENYAIITTPNEIVRGGAIIRSKRVSEDVARISKFLIDFPKGEVFIAKQISLQRTNPKLESINTSDVGGRLGLELDRIGWEESRTYSPTSLLAQIGSNLAEIHLKRHGLNPFSSVNSSYEKKKRLEVQTNNSDGNRLVNLFNNLIVKNKEENVISTYNGGAGSALGIGKTIINRTEFTNLQTTVNTLSYDIISKKNKNISNKIDENFTSTTDYGFYNIESRINLGNPSDISLDRKFVGSKSEKTVDTINKLTVFYANDIANPDKTKSVFIHPIKEIPLRPENGELLKLTRDLIKFRIEVMDLDNPNFSYFIVMRANITGLQDNYSSNTENISYNGRGDDLFLYAGGFKREVSFNFLSVAQSRGEMKSIYQKLNYLASVLAPNYKNQQMRGNIVKLTIGDYIYRQPAIIRSLSLTPPTDSTWEIAMDEPENGMDNDMYELPHAIDGNVSFQIIHNFLPQTSLHKSGFIIPINDNKKWLSEIKDLPNKKIEKVDEKKENDVNKNDLKQKDIDSLKNNLNVTSIQNSNSYTAFNKKPIVLNG